MSFRRSSCSLESKTVLDKSVQESSHFRVGRVFRDSLSATLISQIRKIRVKGFGQSDPEDEWQS